MRVSESTQRFPFLFSPRETQTESEAKRCSFRLSRGGGGEIRGEKEEEEMEDEGKEEEERQESIGQPVFGRVGSSIPLFIKPLARPVLSKCSAQQVKFLIVQLTSGLHTTARG